MLKVGDIVYYDREVYHGFLSFLYDRKHVITKVDYDEDGSIYRLCTKGYDFNYSDHRDGSPNELKTSDADLISAIKLCHMEKWTGSSLKFNFVI